MGQSEIGKALHELIGVFREIDLDAILKDEINISSKNRKQKRGTPLHIVSEPSLSKSLIDL